MEAFSPDSVDITLVSLVDLAVTFPAEFTLALEVFFLGSEDLTLALEEFSPDSVGITLAFYVDLAVTSPAEFSLALAVFYLDAADTLVS